MAGNARVLSPQESLPLKCGRLGVAISWDHGGSSTVDVDLQAVVVNNQGTIIDAVYFNNMKALKCITHSGDETTGEKDGFDEMIWVGLSKLPADVKMLVFVVAAHSGGHLRDVRNGMIHVLEERKDTEVARIAMERSEEEVDVVATLIRAASGAWAFNAVDEPAQDGQHFMDVLEPTIGNLIRAVIPTAPKRQKVAFAMEKGAVLDLPETAQLSSITAGLGWDVAGKGVDLDVSAVLLDDRAEHVDTIFFGKLVGSGLRHSGDNLTGEGDGDDEQIQVDLAAVPARATQIFFVVNVYTKGVTFQQVSNAYCRVFDARGDEMARYVLAEGGRESCLIMSRLFREGGARWGFQAIGTFSRGNMWKDALLDMVGIHRMAPRALQLRGSSTMMFSGENGGGGAAPAEGKKDCVLQ